jgi:hypothetical protein
MQLLNDFFLEFLIFNEIFLRHENKYQNHMDIYNTYL